MSCFCLFRETNYKSVSLGIAAIIGFGLSLQSVNKVAVKLQVPWASNMNFN